MQPESAPIRDPRVHAIATELLSERGEYLLAIACRNTENRDDAEEAFQQAFLIMLDKFNPDEAPALPWMITTLKRECWRRWRKAAEQLLLPPMPAEEDGATFGTELIPDPRRGPGALVEISERTTEVGSHLAQLKPDHSRCLGLKALGYSYVEISEITGWTYTKINRCMFEGRARLRDLSA